jgi:hypothetical protein
VKIRPSARKGRRLFCALPFALYRLIQYSMTQFTDFITNAVQEATGIMGEPISINGQTVQAVFDEQTNSWK